METSVIDMLFLELSQITTARTAKEIKITNNFMTMKAKCDKLKRLLLLTDDKLLAVISDEDKICGSDLQLAQWQEFIREFPDEA